MSKWGKSKNYSGDYAYIPVADESLCRVQITCRNRPFAEIRYLDFLDATQRWFLNAHHPTPYVKILLSRKQYRTYIRDISDNHCYLLPILTSRLMIMALNRPDIAKSEVRFQIKWTASRFFSSALRIRRDVGGSGLDPGILRLPFADITFIAPQSETKILEALPLVLSALNRCEEIFYYNHREPRLVVSQKFSPQNTKASQLQNEP